MCLRAYVSVCFRAYLSARVRVYLHTCLCVYVSVCVMCVCVGEREDGDLETSLVTICAVIGCMILWWLCLQVQPKCGEERAQLRWNL